MKTPKISICIPAYRKENIEEAILSIVKQYDSRYVRDNTEICIVDDNSKDKKYELIKKYSKKYGNINYYANKKRAGMQKNLLMPAIKAEGEYIWFLSDDDMLRGNSINRILKTLKKYNPDVIICNLDECSRDMKKVLTKNSLNVNKDMYLHGRKELYKFLNTKFFYNIDWYTTYYSNLIIKKEIFDLSYKLSKKYKSSLDLFPQSLGIFYSENDYNIYIASQRLIKYRNSNISWGPKKKKEFLLFGSRLYDNHYDNIMRINKDILPLSFKLKLIVKKFIKHFRVYILLPVFGY